MLIHFQPFVWLHYTYGADLSRHSETNQKLSEVIKTVLDKTRRVSKNRLFDYEFGYLPAYQQKLVLYHLLQDTPQPLEFPCKNDPELRFQLGL